MFSIYPCAPDILILSTINGRGGYLKAKPVRGWGPMVVKASVGSMIFLNGLQASLLFSFYLKTMQLHHRKQLKEIRRQGTMGGVENPYGGITRDYQPPVLLPFTELPLWFIFVLDKDSHLSSTSSGWDQDDWMIYHRQGIFSRINNLLFISWKYKWRIGCILQSYTKVRDLQGPT